MYHPRTIRRIGSTVIATCLAVIASCTDAASPKADAPVESQPVRTTGVNASTSLANISPNECASPRAGWVFCDDFESNRLSSYYEYDNAGGKFVRAASTGVGGSVGMKATYTKGQSSAGNLKIAFGRTPSSYFRPVDGGTSNYRELYWRFFVRRDAGWVGNGAGKLTRATIFAKSDWSQAMTAHAWTSDGDSQYLMIDPASGTDASGRLITSGYNDIAHLRWLGTVQSATPEEDQAHVGQWACYEYHVKLNDAGQSNGIFEFSVNDQLSARKTGLNWVGSYNAYGLNSVFLEQYTNSGAPAANVRTLDNFVISTQPIGCTGTASPASPAPPTVATVRVSLAASTLPVGGTTQASATPLDAAGNALTGQSVVWTSSNNNVAKVATNGLVTAIAAGTANIVATSDGHSGSATITVRAAGPAKLQIVSQPSSSAISGSAFAQQPVIQVRDAQNNAVAQAGISVTARIASGGGTLGGSTTVTTNASGVATFTNLSISGTDGSRTLGFSSGALTGATSTTINVTAPATLPPPTNQTAACPNEPSGYTVLNDQPWNTTPIRNVQTSMGWIDDGGNGASAWSILNDATAPYPSSNHNVIAGLFRQGSPGGSGPFYTYRPFASNEQYKDIYICLYLKHSAGFDNTNGNTGTKFLWPAGDQVQGTQTYNGFDSQNMNFAFFQQGAVDRRLDANMNQSSATLLNKRGQWVRFEMLLRASSSNSAADGGLDVWIDGVQTHHFTNVRWQMGASRTWRSLAWNPTYGGGTNPVPHDQYQYIDNIRISGR